MKMPENANWPQIECELRHIAAQIQEGLLGIAVEFSGGGWVEKPYPENPLGHDGGAVQSGCAW